MRTANLWIGVVLGAALLYSCSKSNYNNTPTIVYKSVNQTLVPWNNANCLVTFTMDLTESQYNPNDSLYVFMNVPNCEEDSALLSYPMTSLASGVPTTTSGSGFKATMDVSFSNGEYYFSQGYPNIEDPFPCTTPTGANQYDTAYFFFCVGHVGHYSDTAKSGAIVLESKP